MFFTNEWKDLPSIRLYKHLFLQLNNGILVNYLSGEIGNEKHFFV